MFANGAELGLKKGDAAEYTDLPGCRRYRK